MISENNFIHETAIVDAGVKIGRDNRIWHWTHICAKASIGNNNSFGQNVFIADNVSIGDNNKIQNNVSIFEGVRLEQFVFCGPSMVFTNVINPRSEFPKQKQYNSTLVKKGVTLGANCTVVCGIVLHEYAFIGAGSLVNRDVPAFALMVGVPAKRIGWMCKCGEKLKNEHLQKCNICGSKFKIESEICELVD